MLKKFIFSLAAVIALSVVAMAQDKSLTGYIVDQACATGKVAKQAKPQEAAANESKNCILMEGCLKSGLGVYADGKYYKLDEKGKALAKAALEKSKKDKGAKFKVSGNVTGDQIAVTGIEEITE